MTLNKNPTKSSRTGQWEAVMYKQKKTKNETSMKHEKKKRETWKYQRGFAFPHSWVELNLDRG